MSDPQQSAPDADSAGVKVPPPLIVLLVILAGYGLQQIWPFMFPLQAGLTILVLGLGLVLVGVALAVIATSFVQFRRAKTDIRPHKPTNAIIRSGLYQYSRNPIYVSFLILQTGIGLLMNNIWVVLLVAATSTFLSKYVIAREEAYLERAFGEDYLNFKRSVRRWL